MMEFLGLAAGWFGRPMFDEPAEARWAGRALLGVGALLVVAGFLWIRRTTDPGPLARGDATWRYRDRDRIEGQNRLAAFVRLPRRTHGWWATRVRFGVAIAALGVGLGWILMAAMGPQPLSRDPELRPGFLVQIAAYAGMWIGFAWMIRIYRAGLRNDAEATWRYRDRQS